MSKRWRYRLITGLALASGTLVWFALTAHQLWFGILFLMLAIALWVLMALLVP